MPILASAWGNNLLFHLWREPDRPDAHDRESRPITLPPSVPLTPLLLKDNHLASKGLLLDGALDISPRNER
eukprot:scaffold11391_cov125-Isochrysis_galbana.AAC.9